MSEDVKNGLKDRFVSRRRLLINKFFVVYKAKETVYVNDASINIFSPNFTLLSIGITVLCFY